ncbi:Pseudomonapepsin precursor (EC 3.4.21.100) (plasmid) [Mycetohabitans rhizoxinica HKI 454]|uniref:Pseudomonapepsin n=1 Tax=Mycetohabitans rhizoxinica (strain DSM 19002 / CIP 109453 / HKI 454) TaxID=882378 RepID=E5AWC6_MYCRK|nr:MULTISPECIES: S53 family peptidase [Mycetohabitans]MCG1048661.1 S53 family peptidase [Mycetohabitans sp. B6]CBW77428.1 Pseudomonapepsin precursor (EC 3.4.21.100) [Mycetohabitans rhizoxinica HKI 454]
MHSYLKQQSHMQSYLEQENHMRSYLEMRKKPYFDDLANIRPGGLTPAQVCQAYQFAKVQPVRPVKLGIVSLAGQYLSSDMSKAFTGYGLPTPVVSTAGSQVLGDLWSNVENMMDIEIAGAAWAYATGTAATLLMQFEPNNETGIPNAINALVAAGCEVISISWGAPANLQTMEAITARKEACKQAAVQNVHVFAASGDESLNDGTNSRTPDDPCCDPNVWGVGGTRLVLQADGSIAQESAWGDGNAADKGGGGGFDSREPLPDYQVGVVHSEHRGSPDSSANADPGTGYAIVANGQWLIGGGTSASAPLTAGYVAAILSTLPGPISQSVLQRKLYTAHKTAFRDILLGSNGAPARPGWEEATGLGSINGPGLAAALQS